MLTTVWTNSFCVILAAEQQPGNSVYATATSGWHQKSFPTAWGAHPLPWTTGVHCEAQSISWVCLSTVWQHPGVECGQQISHQVAGCHTECCMQTPKEDRQFIWATSWWRRHEWLGAVHQLLCTGNHQKALSLICISWGHVRCLIQELQDWPLLDYVTTLEVWQCDKLLNTELAVRPLFSLIHITRLCFLEIQFNITLFIAI